MSTDGLIVNTRGTRRTSGGNEFPATRPSWSLTGSARSWRLLHPATGLNRELTIAEALTIQGFDATYAVTGSRTRQFLQVANSIPPPLAAAILAVATGPERPATVPNPYLIRDDYAGPGGWSEGLKRLGLVDVGIEWDADACATRAANGHLTIRADLATYRTPHLIGRLRLYIASPPCQTFSAAGKGHGARQVDRLVDIVDRQAWEEAEHLDPRTRHVIDTARNCVELGARSICLEQVPSVLPIWQAIARLLDGLGYSTWTGKLVAADYGVPQTRTRAVLIASLDRTVDRPPATHAEHPAKAVDLFTTEPAPWVTMLDALGPDFAHRLGELDRGQRSRQAGWRDNPDLPMAPSPTVATTRPAPTVTSQSPHSGNGSPGAPPAASPARSAAQVDAWAEAPPDRAAPPPTEPNTSTSPSPRPSPSNRSGPTTPSPGASPRRGGSRSATRSRRSSPPTSPPRRPASSSSGDRPIPPTQPQQTRRTAMIRKLTTLAAGIALTVVAVACQPLPAYGPPRPPANAVHAHGIADAPIVVDYGFGNPRCRYTLTVLEDGHDVIQTITGGPANGSELVTVPRTGTYSAWITSTPVRGCSRKLRLIDSL